MCETHLRQAPKKKKNRRALKLASPLPQHTLAALVQGISLTAPSSRETTDLKLCKHPSKCSEERTVKKNGELHWLCERHRQLKNAEQRQRYDRQKRFASSRKTGEDQARDVNSLAHVATSSSSSQAMEPETSLCESETPTASQGTNMDTTKSGSHLKNQQCDHRSECARPRALKKNGNRHWLCEYYRQQQNALQRRRRRQLSAIRHQAVQLELSVDEMRVEPNGGGMMMTGSLERET
ncbi:hypothetical protein F442_04216 [Phytophthora nicotianae P10297]|nr:hypothetical protein L914_04075 [Phytophthora nicotianae]ETO81397.1 hypothetical protein F444_04302 [Phytophthora nicotianae P1976]ETP50515.1 hypothetical protein F442_04216 [Phytophthora nicotianae P10297]